MNGRSADSTAPTAETDGGVRSDRADIRTDRRLERALWIAFGVLFVAVALSMSLPVEPIVLVFPLWSLLALAAMIAAVAVAAIAGVGYGWPSEYR